METTAVHLRIEQAFLCKLNGDEIYATIKEKIQTTELSDEDLMQLIILPLTQKGSKKQMIEKAFHIAKEIDNEEDQAFVIAGILVTSDKFISIETSEEIRSWLGMTKVGKIIQKEIIDAGNESRENTLNEIARTMLLNDEDEAKIMIYTGFTSDKIKSIKETMSK